MWKIYANILCAAKVDPAINLSEILFFSWKHQESQFLVLMQLPDLQLELVGPFIYASEPLFCA